MEEIWDYSAESPGGGGGGGGSRPKLIREPCM